MQKVLIIDDDKFAQKMAARALDQDYETYQANDGEEGIALAKTVEPEYIILDVEMPGMNGYEVCDKLKHDSETQNIPVIFVSSKGDLRDRMQGYEAGGIDYIVKPYDEQLLKAKLDIIHKYRDRQEELSGRVKQAEQTAYTALSNNAELAQILGFVEKSYHVNSFDDLAMLLMDTMEQFKLHTIVRIESKFGDLWHSHRGSASPLEKEIIGLLRKSGDRFQDFGSRTNINYPSISLLIKNMPLDDMERYGRYKDILPVMLGAADAKINIIDAETGVRNQSGEIKHAVAMIGQNLNEITRSMIDNRDESKSVLQNIFRELSEKLPTMALEDDQEEFIMSRLEQALKTTHQLIDKGDAISQRFRDIVTSLAQLSSQQNNLLDIFLNKQIPDRPAPQESYGSDIELF